jgi:hypothetical protein
MTSYKDKRRISQWDERSWAQARVLVGDAEFMDGNIMSIVKIDMGFQRVVGQSRDSTWRGGMA